MIKTKLCGFTTKSTILLAIENKADFIGFVFHLPSPRNISPELSFEITKDIDFKDQVKKVAVFVDASDQEIAQIIKFLKPDFLQIHSSDRARILEIKNHFKIPIIKAFSIKDIQDLGDVDKYESIADLFLFDTKTKNSGGSGKTFDWKILQNFTTKKDWFLSGGLNTNNIEEALKITNTKMVDLSSGIEEVRGIKSPELIKQFMTKISQF